jgi:hypothetical protein
MEAQNAYVTSLYSPGDWAAAKIKILGDPDFLTSNPPGGLNEVYNQFYRNDRTINANGGQVFIEIDFAEGVDYNNDTGTMDINSSIFITDYPPAAKIEGICYQVIDVKSTFNNGSFVQEINANAVTTFPAAKIALAPPGRGANSEGTAGEAEARENLAAQTGAASAAQAGLSAQATASNQITAPAAGAVATQASFSDEQLKWLGGADQTDPFIIARMKAAVPDSASAGTSVSDNPSAPDAVANDDASYTASENNMLPANNDGGREDSQTDRASGS